MYSYCALHHTQQICISSDNTCPAFHHFTDAVYNLSVVSFVLLLKHQNQLQYTTHAFCSCVFTVKKHYLSLVLQNVERRDPKQSVSCMRSTTIHKRSTMGKILCVTIWLQIQVRTHYRVSTHTIHIQYTHNNLMSKCTNSIRILLRVIYRQSCQRDHRTTTLIPCNRTSHSMEMTIQRSRVIAFNLLDMKLVPHFSE